MKIIIILFTLCGKPGYFTVQDDTQIMMYPATVQVAKAIEDKYKGKEIIAASLPADKALGLTCL